MKKWQYWVLGIHTLIILYVLWGDLNAKGENWSWLLPFIVDFPLAMIFYPVIDFILRHFLQGGTGGDTRAAFMVLHYSAHLIIGGAWWVMIAFFIRKLFTKLQSTPV